MRQGHIHPSLEDPPDHGWEEALNSIQAGRISSRPWAMIYIGVDIHRNKSQVAALDREGNGPLPSSRGRLSALKKAR